MASADEIFSALIAPVEGKMMRTVAGITGNADDAADAFQNIQQKISRNLEKIAGHPNPQGYIIKICVSASYDVLRNGPRQRRWSRIFALTPPHTVVGAARETAPVAGAAEGERELFEAISRLPRQQAQAIMLYAVEDMDYGQLAAALNCTEATARSHVSKGKAKLREALGRSVKRKKRP